jgi:predicted kinase
MLIIFAGLPGVGKTTIARELARHLTAVHLRVDSIEQPIRDFGVPQPLNDIGYRVGYAVASDNLLIGQTVIADSVNPLQLTRDAWLAVALRAGTAAAEVEIICSNQKLHRQRLEMRPMEIKGLKLPTWEEVVSRKYEPWSREHIVIDTAEKNIAEIVRELGEVFSKR